MTNTPLRSDHLDISLKGINVNFQSNLIVQYVQENWRGIKSNTMSNPLYRIVVYEKQKGRYNHKYNHKRASRLLLGGKVALGVQVLNDLLNSIDNGEVNVLDVHLGVGRSLVGSGDTSELLDDTLTSLLVETLGVTLLSDLNGNIDVDLDERQTGLLTGGGDLVQLTGTVTVLLVGGDEGGDGDGVGVGEQLGDLTDAADVLVAVGLAEAQVLVQTETDVVTVQTVGVDAAVTDELVLELDGNGGLAGGGETGQPDGETLLLAQIGALGASEAAGVEGDVAGGG